MACSSVNFTYVEQCEYVVGLKLFVYNRFMHLELVTIRTLYTTHSKFQVDQNLFILYLNKFHFLYVSKYTQYYSAVFFGMVR